MTCPYCELEMEKGSIPCTAGGFRNVKWRSNEGKNSVVLMRALQGENLVTSKISDVFYCKTCNLIIKKISEE